MQAVVTCFFPSMAAGVQFAVQQVPDSDMYPVATDGVQAPHASGGGRDVCSGNTGKRISIIPLNCGERIR